MPEQTRLPRVVVRLDPDTADHVEALARHWGTTAVGVLRQAVAEAARRELPHRSARKPGTN